MRKDVKLGFAVGGVLLAVLIVYVSVMGRANRPVAANQPGANTSVVTPAPAREAETAPSDPFGAQASNQPAAADPNKPTDLNWDALLASGPVTSRTPEAAQPVQPAPAAAPAPAPVAQPTIASPTPSNATAIRTFDPGDQARATTLNPPAGPAPTALAAPKPAKQHVVAQGESLSSISTALFGTPRYANAIAQANPSINPNRLKIGTKLTIPDITAAKAAAPKVEDINVGRNEYRVAQGDNLFRISMKLYGKGDRAEKIYELNKDRIGSDRSKLKLNMVLKLPEAPTVASR